MKGAASYEDSAHSWLGDRPSCASPCQIWTIQLCSRLPCGFKEAIGPHIPRKVLSSHIGNFCFRNCHPPTFELVYPAVAAERLAESSWKLTGVPALIWPYLIPLDWKILPELTARRDTSKIPRNYLPNPQKFAFPKTKNTGRKWRDRLALLPQDLVESLF